ncbi:fumarylacetoacetate hydrolase family protein [Streptomyces sp. NPDC058409]|uniref:fumarylacetoacetate hydrolase family protein n=1 Tax=Streptomyces sp. NPDC058409 TaxID=3346484 RepID=UPI0036622A17
MKFMRLGPVGSERPTVLSDDSRLSGLSGTERQRPGSTELHHQGHDLQREPIVRCLSQYMVIEPGDTVITGTPAKVATGLPGTPHLQAGDTVELGLDGPRSQRQMSSQG